MPSSHKPDTLGVRAGGLRSDFQEHSEALALTTSFVYKSAAEAARKFANEEPGNIYSRFTNPTVTMFQSRLAALEGAEAAVATSTGMAAITTMALGLLKSGDHLVTHRGVFGTVVPLFDQILARLGIATTWVDLPDIDAWRAAVRPNTRLLYAESPTNPVCEVADIAALAGVAKNAKAVLAIDNAMASPALQRPISMGADLVVHSATKYIDGQGRVLAGAIAGRADLVNGPLFNFVRTAGPAISPFNAWICLKGMETLRLRVKAHSENALAIARWLEAHPGVERVHYPGLESHPQHALAMLQQSGAGGPVLSFVVKGGREAAWRVIDAVKMISITANFGDVKSTICHPASTTHFRLSPADREAARISDGLIRLGVGLEDPSDIRADLESGLGGLTMARSARVFLMCPPEYFTVAYIINPWMHGNLRKIDNAVAKLQWRALYDILTDHATVRLVLPQPGSPDMVFTANAGLVKGNRFVVSRFRFPERQYEEPYFADWFMDRGYDVSLMPRDVPFEGAGDALFDRAQGCLWMAHGHRSIPAARGIIADRLGIEVEVLKLVDQRFYHLDTCFCPLEGGYAMYYPPAFDDEGRASIERRIPAARRIAIGEEDALAFACNAVNIDSTVVVNRASAAFVKTLARQGFEVVQTPLSEFMKAGGSAKCLTLRLDEP